MAVRSRSDSLRVVVPREDLRRLRMALGRVSRVHRQQSDDELSYTLTSLLFTIGRTEPATATELAENEKVTAPSVSRSLNRLEALNLIERSADQNDGRVTRICMTEAGRKARDAILRSREEWLTERLALLTAEERTLLFQALPALEHLCDPNEAPRS
ncbi:MAG: MarR family transcriptional regulator [bacterium]|nr:MarR family transcriptional regulator [bacterium]